MSLSQGGNPLPASDKIHNAVKNALIKDGWTITADPYVINYQDARLFADFGAERILAAERGADKIVVEGKSFISPSLLHDFQVALGQFLFYQGLLALTAPERKLYLAVTNQVHEAVFSRPSVQVILEEHPMPMLVIDADTEEVVQWIS